MNPLPLILSAGLLALFAAGCGGDDEQSGSSTTAGGSNARGYAETSEAVSDICKRANAEIDPLSSKATGQAANDAPLLEQVVEINGKYVAELKEIVPDPKLQEAFDAYVASIEQTQSKGDEALAAAKSGDQAAYDKALEELSASDDANKPFARALGATECNKD